MSGRHRLSRQRRRGSRAPPPSYRRPETPHSGSPRGEFQRPSLPTRGRLRPDEAVLSGFFPTGFCLHAFPAFCGIRMLASMMTRPVDPPAYLLVLSARRPATSGGLSRYRSLRGPIPEGGARLGRSGDARLLHARAQGHVASVFGAGEQELRFPVASIGTRLRRRISTRSSGRASNNRARAAFTLPSMSANSRNCSHGLA